jgi:hypothetical protein
VPPGNGLLSLHNIGSEGARRLLQVSNTACNRKCSNEDLGEFGWNHFHSDGCGHTLTTSLSTEWVKGSRGRTEESRLSQLASLLETISAAVEVPADTNAERQL